MIGKRGVFGQVKNNSTILITSLIISWIVGGLFEETIFRGFMISKFMKHINPKIGAVIGALFTSVLFGFIRWDSRQLKIFGIRKIEP